MTKPRSPTIRVSRYCIGIAAAGMPRSINQRIAAADMRRKPPKITLAPHRVWSVPKVVEVGRAPD